LTNIAMSTHLQHFSLTDITCRLAGTDLSLEPIGGLANGAAGPKQTLDDLEPAACDNIAYIFF